MQLAINTYGLMKEISIAEDDFSRLIANDRRNNCIHPDRTLSCRDKKRGKMSGLLLPECLFIGGMVCFYWADAVLAVKTDQF